MERAGTHGDTLAEVYRPRRVRQMIFEVKIGIYSVGILSEPVTDREWAIQRPILRAFVLLKALLVTGAFAMFLYMLYRVVNWISYLP